MRTWRPMCPRCGSREVRAEQVILEASDETFTSTHVCGRCHFPFVIVPPSQQCLQAYRLPEVHSQNPQRKSP